MVLYCACTGNEEDNVFFGGIWTIDDILQCQKISDFLIAIAYFSIPLELFYFITCSTIFPSFRWVLTQFSAFIVLCGLTHLLTIWSYYPQLMLTLTILKLLTAFVSCATSITLVSLIPQLLKVMVKEGLLMKKTMELNREVGLMKKREEDRWHVRMLTREIRSSLDRHTILYTTMIELSKVLFLENCGIWMPDEVNPVMNLTHELNPRRNGGLLVSSIPVDDTEVIGIVEERGVRVLGFDSKLSRLTGRGGGGAGVGIRMPMLAVSSFDTMESMGSDAETTTCCYAVLVLVLPLEGNRCWGSQEIEIVEVVADQVTVALSHAAVLEESMLMREKLLEQNMALQKAKKMALMANEARCSFRKVMSGEMIAPARTIGSILSVLQLEGLRTEEQKRMVDIMAKGSLLLSALIKDATGGCVSGFGDTRLELKTRAFSLHSMLKEVAGVSNLLCACRRQSFDLRVSEVVPDRVIGDETRILQAVLYMVGNVSGFGEGGNVVLSVYIERGSQDSLDSKYRERVKEVSGEFTYLRFEVGRMDVAGSLSIHKHSEKFSFLATDQGLDSNICGQLAELGGELWEILLNPSVWEDKLMHGSVSLSPTSEGVDRTINLTIRLQLQRSEGGLIKPGCIDPETARCLLKGMNTLLMDCDGFNRSITRKLIENLGCHLTIATSWKKCLELLHPDGNNYHLLLIDLGMLEEEGLQLFAMMISKLTLGNWLLVIALTVRSDRNIRDRCLQNGFHGVICKPIILQEMEDELQRIFHQATEVSVSQ